MKARNRKAAMLCALSLTAAALAAGTMYAEETEAVTEAAVAEDDAKEVIGDEELSTEPETEAPVIPRPEYNALDYVTLGQYKGLTIELDPIEVTDDEIDSRINSNIKLSADGSETLTEGKVQNGDTANIDFEGKKDDVAFDGGTAEGYDLEIGSGTFIPGFEEGLVDVEIGQTVDLPLTFPENYGNADLAGQDVVFTVTVHSVKRPKEISDELASKLSDGEATTVAAYRELVASDLMDEKKANQEANTKGEILTLVANNSTINEYPQELIDYTVNQMTDYYKSYAEAYSMNFEEFLTAAFGITEDQFMEEAEFSAKENLQQEIYVNAIAEQEDLVPDDAALKAKADELAVTYGYESGDDLIAAYGEAVVKNSIVYDEVMNFLVENTNIIEKSEAESESDFAETETDVTVLE